MDAHPESFSLKKDAAIARWKVMSCTTNLPMCRDEARHRLFVGCRTPAKLVLFDSESGKIVASPAMVEHPDDRRPKR